MISERLKILATLGLALFLLAVFSTPCLARNSKFDEFKDKLPPVLQNELEFLDANPDYDYPLPVIVKLKTPAPIPAKAKGLPLTVGYKHKRTAKQLYNLLKNPNVSYITLNSPLETFSLPGLLSNPYVEAIGADQVKGMGYDGTGIGVAVFDSGVIDEEFGARVVERVRFTSGVAETVTPLEADPFGHGSHVASIIGGDGSFSGGEHAGVAPGVNLISVQVVDGTGYGETANLISAIDWVIQNKDLHNIRVANLSLGRAPLDSYVDDPLCQAVEQMVDAGIVTVVSAGNFGKNAQYPEIWKSITSPGNSPAVITVSALNTLGTADNDDDVATTFSSRGPSYPDELFKPDLTAPGNGIPGLRAVGSWIDLNHPELLLSTNASYFSLSGSSMATAFVSGTAALMLQANPELTPRLVKALMILSAIKLDQPHILEQGNGLVNAYLAVQLAEAVDSPGRAIGTQNVAPYWYRGSKKVWAGGALATGNQVVYSGLVSTNPSSYWGSGLTWSTNFSWSPGSPWANGMFSPSSPIWARSDQIWIDGYLWTDSYFWTDSYIWTDANFWTDSHFWTDAIFWTNGSIATNGEFWTDATFASDDNGGGQ